MAGVRATVVKRREMKLYLDHTCSMLTRPHRSTQLERQYVGAWMIIPFQHRQAFVAADG